LFQNIPNPFTKFTTISYQIPFESKVSLKIYDVAGKLVRTIVEKREKPGYYTVVWDGKDDRNKKVGSGVYFYKLKAGKEKVCTKKLILM
jgi:flagellar hook assembly protein FlgD